MSKNDAKIKELLEKVEEQKANLGVKPRGSWITNGIFKYDDKNYFNLNTVQNFQGLVDALAFLLEKNLLQETAAKRLEIEQPAFIWNGYSLEDWEADFKKRIEIVNWQKRKELLDKTKKKLHALISEETKTEMELDDIAKLLS